MINPKNGTVNVLGSWGLFLPFDCMCLRRSFPEKLGLPKYGPSKIGQASKSFIELL
jgi:hypothetical protein